MDTPHGKFVWNELNTHDPEAARAFLAETIGWTFEAMDMAWTTYWVIKQGEESVGGIFDMTGQGLDEVPENWMAYLAVDDVDRRVEKAVAAGASVIRPAFDVPGVGRIAILRQPGGAVVGWMKPDPSMQ